MRFINSTRRLKPIFAPIIATREIIQN
ncbi:hypothetical protein AZE42_13072 [Rhizopogon vesiculosus]|uniref:Uncharacterized protein n=1 Tax=Rhizopogon vesiculosus TaxID=180088 RepID=A0A1J8PUH1_9AGAM|nr:hypothetical protein AZE42_13072 [Rhizopogon vesiculosus]